MAICYKTLFEIKIFHEYYLTDPDGKNVFDFAAQQDRINFLFERFANGKSNINEELLWTVPLSAKKIFKDFHLRLVPSYAGCKVAIEVIPQILPDGTRTYTPKVKLPDNTSFPLLLLKKNNQVDAYTNGRMDRSLNSGFYFSNAEFSGAKVFPFLANSIPIFDPAAAYEQGEFVSHGVNFTRAFYRDSADVVQWLTLNGSGYASENDRLLVPLRFFYSFRPADNVTTADVVLKDSNGNVVAEYRFSDAEPLRKIFIPVPADKVVAAPEKPASPELVYTLEVSGDNGFANSLKLVFYNGEENISATWAMVDINVRSANNNFDLLDGAGLLITRKAADGTFNPLHPVFEIGVRSKLTFWRYINDKRNDFLNNLHPDQLQLLGGMLVTTTPRPLSFTPVFFKKPDNSPYYLPNPKPHGPTRSEGNKLYSEVYVSKSTDLFPAGP
ncbi:MAG: hypothetical protein C0490_20710, partial [Marivirga sp.]|nr:hypothetical protein [Marivirga sp.]